MTLFAKIISVALLSIVATNSQESKLYKRWKIIADKRIFLNLDGTAHAGFKNRIDSVKNGTVFIEFFKDGNFKSVEGNGTFSTVGDSLYLKLPEGDSSFKFEVKNNALYLTIDDMRDDYIRREVLHGVAM